MSAGAIVAAGGIETREQAALARMQQLQELIEASRQMASPNAIDTSAYTAGGESSAGGFASALQAATGSAAEQPVSYDTLDDVSGEASRSSQYEAMIEQAAERNGIEPALLHGLIEQESGFDPNATSSAGAAGLTQLMPGTASSLGVANALDPAEAIEGGARYLGELSSEFGGNTTEALAAYNAGPGAVEQYGGVPPYAETESYVEKVLGYAESYRQSHPGGDAALTSEPATSTALAGALS